jgi:hypothetical protein
LKYHGEYFGYCTGDAEDGNLFGVLHSKDLVNWTYVGSAMPPLATRPPFYWAPEVVYDNGRFYLYYSAGNEILMEIRVAVSDRPDGGFVDQGVRLTHEEFAIDAHVFIDDDGTRYMFYATDFLEYSHIGTGTVVDRMVDWKTLEGKPRPVTRAKYDWQVYDPARKEKGGVRWHTVEGPTVLKRKGKYFEMFSGGNWQNKSYGVSFAVTDSMNFKDEWTQFSDGEKILPILRTIPEKVIGPGHNSVVRGPNNRELYCIYHRWTDAGRVLAIDRMDFAGDRIFVAGPTTTEQPMPFLPIAGTQLISDLPSGWAWNDDELVNSLVDPKDLPIVLPGVDFLLELSFRVVEAGDNALFAIGLDDARFEFDQRSLMASVSNGRGDRNTIMLATDFDPAAYHLLRIEKGCGHCRVMIDDIGKTAEVSCAGNSSRLTIIADGIQVAISAIELTPGFEELFTDSESSKPESNQPSAQFPIPYSDFEFAANLAGDGVSDHGLSFLDESGASLIKIIARANEAAITIDLAESSLSIDLPEAFVGNEYRQFKVVKIANEISTYLDGILLTTQTFSRKVARAAIIGTAETQIDMVRLTAI